ncbi:MAG TPA: flagellar filament capping protein FliD [Candidatus Brocadiaceae bacterium]|nr:flagellar filament capping protein FliD [Candidatus Brocadiaceae bacterium]
MASITSAYNSSSSLNSLINQYMALEQRPLTSLNTKKTSLNGSLNIYTDLNTKLSDLLSVAKDLASTSTTSIYNSRTSSSGDETKITVSAGANAATGTYQIRVKQLATGSTAQSTAKLNTKYSTTSTSKVAPGTGVIDVSKSFSSAGFASTPDGTVTINGQPFTLSSYSTVQAFMDAVNGDVTANANIYYNSTEDKFYIEQKSTSTNLVISETPDTSGNGFFTQAKITTGTYTTNNTGIQSNVLLYKANFDTALLSTDSGSFKINGITITWDADTDSLDSVISRINSSTANVTAYYDNSLDKMVIKSKGTGSTDKIYIEDTSGFLNTRLKLTLGYSNPGTNALFTINSADSNDEISKSANTFTINGTTYTLKNTNVTNYTDTTHTTITVKQDTSTIQSKITGFLDKFNSTIEYIKNKSSVDTSTKTRGPLAGNATFTSLRSQLLEKLSGQVTGLTAGNPDYLNEIGITFDSSLKASLSDTAKFNSVITSNSKSVEDLFNSTNGIANKIQTLLTPFVESTSSTRGSIIYETKTTINKQITDINTRISRMEERLKIKENQYRQQLYKMQDLLNNLVLQGSQITSLINY